MSCTESVTEKLVYILVEHDDYWTRLGTTEEKAVEHAKSLLAKWYGFDDEGKVQAVDTIDWSIRFFAIPESRIYGKENDYVDKIFGETVLTAWDVLLKMELPWSIRLEECDVVEACN